MQSKGWMGPSSGGNELINKASERGRLIRGALIYSGLRNALLQRLRANQIRQMIGKDLRMNANMSAVGQLGVRVMRGSVQAPLSWRMRNWLRPGFWLGWLAVMLARLFTRLTKIPTVTSQLAVRLVRADGVVVDFGRVCFRLVTTAGVNWLVDAWQGTYEPETMKYHGCGTGTGAEAVGDTALGTESTTALNPDSTRATGSLAEGGSANIFRSVGTLTFDGSAAITEHGLFNQAATGGGTLWDRSLFSAINVASGDSIQFTYDLTINSGG